MVEILNETNIKEYIKKTARFYFDFLLVHPYDDGNGRTARLLTIMLLNYKNINLTSLFAGNIDNYEFNVEKANNTLNNNYEPLENSLLNIIQERCSANVLNNDEKENNVNLEIQK